MKLVLVIVIQIILVCVICENIDETVITESCDYFHLTSFGLISFFPEPKNAENSKYYCRKLGSIGFPILNTPDKINEVVNFIQKCHGNNFKSTIRYGSNKKNCSSKNTFIRIGIESKTHERYWPDGSPLSLNEHNKVVSTELNEKDNFDVFFSNGWSLPVSLPECSELLLNIETGKIEAYQLCDSKEKILDFKSFCCHGELEIPFLCWFHGDKNIITDNEMNNESTKSNIWVMVVFIIGFVIGSFIVGCFIKRRHVNSHNYGDRLNLVDDYDEVEFENTGLEKNNTVKYISSTREQTDSVSINFTSSDKET